MKKNTILENIYVEKLVFSGKGFAVLQSENKDISGKKIFISGGVIPGSTVNIRVLKNRKDFIEGQVVEVIKKSDIEKIHENNIYGIQPGIMWINIPYEEQLKIKYNQINESIFHLKKIDDSIEVSNIIPSPLIDNYRNKIEFSFGKFISQKLGINEDFNVGFHKQGEFSKILDYDGTILISKLANKIYKEIKDFSKKSSFPVYDQYTQKGFFRHIVIREGFFTKQIMIIFGVNHEYENYSDDKFLIDFFSDLASRFPEIKSIYLSLNNQKADISIGDLKLIYGNENIEEKIFDLTFSISPNSFFQTNSFGVQKLYKEILNQIDLDELKNHTILDLYGGTGTIGMIFAKYSKKIISVDIVKNASLDGIKNAKKNGINNMEFINAKTEDFLKIYLNENKKADLIIIDPPRAGMHPKALNNILNFGVKNIIYVSCNPSTLSRDLYYIITNSSYKIKKITPFDMFPHTHHIETIVKLEK